MARLVACFQQVFLAYPTKQELPHRTRSNFFRPHQLGPERLVTSLADPLSSLPMTVL